jgi:hypothetical protein
VSGFGAAVAVRGGEAGDGEAGHEEGAEDAVFDEVDAAGGLAFVVVVVVAAEGDAVEGGQSWVVGDAEEGGQDLLAKELGEGLAFVVAALALASRRWPRTSWKKTAEARPLRMAGPLKGSVTGASRRASRFFAMATVLSVMAF